MATIATPAPRAWTASETFVGDKHALKAMVANVK
jgi:hypothetical protein